MPENAEPTPDGLLGYLQTEMRSLRVDLRGDLAKVAKQTEGLAKQTAREHKDVRKDIQDLTSEVRIANSTANAAKLLSDANAANIAAAQILITDHLAAHKTTDAIEVAVNEERGRWTRWLGEAWKTGVGVLGTLIALYLKAHVG